MLLLSMNCWQCAKQAYGICILCGRAVCKEHYKNYSNILAVYDEDNDKPKAIVVNDALWCGLCKPVPDPVVMPELD